MTNKKGIYDYALISNERSLLSALLMTEKSVKLMNPKKWLYSICWQYFKIEEMKTDYITP